MSSSRSCAAAATRPASPVERSSMTVTELPAASSGSSTWEPMKPAPPVTIGLWLIAAIYAGARGRELRRVLLNGGRRGRELRCSCFDGLVDPFEHRPAFEG